MKTSTSLLRPRLVLLLSWWTLFLALGATACTQKPKQYRTVKFKQSASTSSVKKKKKAEPNTKAFW